MNAKKVALITNFNIFEKANAAMNVAMKIQSFGGRVLVASYNAEKINRLHRIYKDFSYLPIDRVYNEADLIVVLGGDGSILEAARRAAHHATPILGINLGRLGYMAELELAETDLISHYFADDYTVEKRSMLSVELLAQGTRLKGSSYALNDAVICNGSVARLVDLELSEGGVPVTSYRSDGLIVATPTGSTAYSMSAGGPIADPRIACFCVTPICPHSLSARPLIFPDSVTLEIKNICQREKVLYPTVDGRTNYELYRGDVVRITKSQLTASLIRLKTYSFYCKLRQKMAEHRME